MKGKRSSSKVTQTYHELPAMEPATTSNGRESQLAMLALDAMEQRIRNHEASGMELVYCAKLGSQNTRMEQEKHDAEIQLMKAKIDALKAGEARDRLYIDAINAFKDCAIQEE